MNANAAAALKAPASLIFADDLFLKHEPGDGHPERPARLRAILDDFDARPVKGVQRRKPRPATVAELEAVHGTAYVARLRSLAGQHARLDGDTLTSPGSWDAAVNAAGASAAAVEAVWRGEARNAFVCARPPGHHAEASRAMGFCLFNNAAVAAESARRLGAERVLVLDWDVHHGNGTQHIFERRRDVLYMSSHQYPFYPGTGAPDEVGLEQGRGFTVNCALPAGQTDADLGAVFDGLFLPIVAAYKPEVVIVSAGFDPHARDPLGEMQMTERGFAAMCTALRRLAEGSAKGRLVLLLEGGYDLQALAGSARACLEVMTGSNESFPAGAARSRAAIAASVAAQRPFWKI